MEQAIQAKTMSGMAILLVICSASHVPFDSLSM